MWRVQTGSQGHVREQVQLKKQPCDQPETKCSKQGGEAAQKVLRPEELGVSQPHTGLRGEPRNWRAAIEALQACYLGEAVTAAVPGPRVGACYRIYQSCFVSSSRKFYNMGTIVIPSLLRSHLNHHGHTRLHLSTQLPEPKLLGYEVLSHPMCGGKLLRRPRKQ